MKSEKVNQPTQQQFLGLRRTALAMGLTRQQILRGRDKLETALRAIQTGAEIKVLPPLSLPVWAARIVEISVTPRQSFSLAELSDIFQFTGMSSDVIVGLRQGIPYQVQPTQNYVLVERHGTASSLLQEELEWANRFDLRLSTAHDLAVIRDWRSFTRTKNVLDDIISLVVTQGFEISKVMTWPVFVHGSVVRLVTHRDMDLYRNRWYLFRR